MGCCFWRVFLSVALLSGVLTSSTSAQCSEQNGRVVMEVERANPSGEWRSRTSIAGYTGSEYYRWEGPDRWIKNQWNLDTGKLTYNVTINSAGNYQLLIHSRIAHGHENTEHNDVWLRMSGQPISGQHPVAHNQWEKAYQNKLGDWSVSTRTKDHDAKPIRQFFSAGSHKIELSGRSFGFAIDRIVLFKYADYGYDVCYRDTGCDAPKAQYLEVVGLSETCGGNPPPPECSSNSDCADGNPCTNDVCSSGNCSNPNKSNGSACSDGIACTEDQCMAGVCQGNDACGAGMSCNMGTGSCEDDGPTQLVCFSAAENEAATFSGQMTTSPAFSNGSDFDASKDSFFDMLLYSGGSENDFVGNNNDKVVYPVDLPSSGQWFLWGRFYYPGELDSEDANSFWANVDNKSVHKFGNDTSKFRRFHWDGDDDEGNGAPVGPVALGNLSAGSHSLTIRRREVKNIEAGSPVLPPRLDAICLSNDASLMLNDTMAAEALGLGSGCMPMDCDDLNAECGVFSDNCSGTVECGSCAMGESCVPTESGQVCEPDAEPEPDPAPDPNPDMDSAKGGLFDCSVTPHASPALGGIWLVLLGLALIRRRQQREDAR